MQIHRFATPGLSINTYLVIDDATKKAAVIDPTRDVAAIVETAQKEQAEITHILETHVHADFVSGSQELKDRSGNKAIICCSEMGGREWVPKYVEKRIKDGDEIVLGSLKLKALHTPGHTPEHLMWILYEKENPLLALTGDFLFVGSIGRPDLLGQHALQELADKLYESVFTILPKLPDYLEIYPAHGAGSRCGKGINPQPTSTLQIERKTNPFLVSMEPKAWINNLLRDMPKAPSYFSLLKKRNVEGSPLLKNLAQPKQASLETPVFLLDIRSKEDFATSHVKGSINIPFSPSFINWVPEIVPHNSPILIIATDKQTIHQAITCMRMVGLDQLIDFHVLGPEDHLSASFPLISPEAAEVRLKNEPEDFAIIDVRTEIEWRAGHIKNAIPIELSILANNMKAIPAKKSLGLICGSGYRSSIAASMLQKLGYKDVSNIQGGMQAWNKARLPTSK